MNKHMIHGRLVRDPELTPRKNSDGKDRVNFTVATDRRFGDEADFFDCVLFGGGAAVVDKFFRKGSEIVVVGEGQIHSYEDKNGNKRKSYSVVVQDFDFCGSKKDKASSDDSWEQFDEDDPFTP